MGGMTLEERAAQIITVEPDGKTSWRVTLACGDQRSTVIRLSAFEACESYARWLRESIIAPALRAAIAEEREACMRDICPYCLQGEPIVEPAECIAMGHYYNDSIICHPLGRDKEGRVTGHVGCAAAAIRIRGKA